MITLSVTKRDPKMKLDALRKGGSIPAVFYGPKQESTSVSIPFVEFRKAWKKAGESTVIILKEGEAEHEVLIHEVDIHPLSGEPRHADFYVIEKGKKVEVAVPLNFEGVSPAVKDKGGILVKVRRDLDIEAAPRDLPHELIVDISKLVEITDVIQVKDIVLPKGVELKVDGDEVIASISEAKEEVEETPAAIDMSAIEVEAKGKEDKEGDQASPAAGDSKPAPEKK